MKDLRVVRGKPEVVGSEMQAAMVRLHDLWLRSEWARPAGLRDRKARREAYLRAQLGPIIGLPSTGTEEA